MPWYFYPWHLQSQWDRERVLSISSRHKLQATELLICGLWIAGVLILVWTLLYCCVLGYLWWIQQWHFGHARRILLSEVLFSSQILYSCDMGLMDSHKFHLFLIWIGQGTEKLKQKAHLVHPLFQSVVLSNVQIHLHPCSIWNHLWYFPFGVFCELDSTLYFLLYDDA